MPAPKALDPAAQAGLQRVTRCIAQEAAKLRGDVRWAALTESGAFVTLSATKKYKGDVIAIHGTGDRSVPYSCSQYLPYFYKRCELSLIPGADHTFTDLEGIPAGIVAVWMDKKLK